jgi:oxepin-CoA hydrolase/3-oxo-5,6-dehydrosuberyl-CoA semialdehyde dehydrogenase
MYLDELKPGYSVTVGPRKITRADIKQFAALTGDRYYLHTDDAAARDNPIYGGIVAHGYLVMSCAAGLFVTPEPGPVLANLGVDRLRFLAPVRPDDEITVTITVKSITRRPGAGRGEVRWDVEVVDQDDRTVTRYDMLTLMAGKPS